VVALREGLLAGERSDAVRLKRRMVERVLERCTEEIDGDIVPLLTSLQRFAVEAARDEARSFCNDLVAGAVSSEQRLVA
jgi:hypothetical protein